MRALNGALNGVGIDFPYWRSSSDLYYKLLMPNYLRFVGTSYTCMFHLKFIKTPCYSGKFIGSACFSGGITPNSVGGFYGFCVRTARGMFI